MQCKPFLYIDSMVQFNFFFFAIAEKIEMCREI